MPDSVLPASWTYGSVNYVGDHDVYDIYLAAGTAYTFDVHGYSGLAGYVGDPTLTLRASNGAQLAFNDDDGTVPYPLDSHIAYTPGSSGWFQLDVAGFGSHTGGYWLEA